jgi:hypothetical protein
MKLKNKNMSTYILKYNVYNSIDFPKGTIVKIIDPKWEFEVVKGKLKGQRGNIADGLNGWLLENTTENALLFNNFMSEEKKLHDAIRDLNERWELLPTVDV